MSNLDVISIVERYVESIQKTKEVLVKKIKDVNETLQNLEREYEQKIGMLHTGKQILLLVKTTLDDKIEKVKEKEEKIKRTAEEVKKLKELKKEKEAETSNRTIIK